MSPYVKELIAQGDPPKETSTVKEMNGQLILLSSDKMTHYFKEWTTASCILKKTKILSLQKFDASDRSS